MKVWFQMRITLNRIGEVQSFETVLTIESQTDERKDIVELLSLIQMNGGIANKEMLHEAIGISISPVVVDGVLNHLKSIGLLNSNHTLSFRSQKILESGNVPLEERGEFALWYIDDPLLPNYLIHYERSNNRNKVGIIQEFKEFQSFMNRPFVSVLDDSGKDFRIKRFDGTNPKARNLTGKGEYRIQWTIDLSQEEQSELFISGDLKTADFHRTYSNQKVRSFKQEDYKSFLFEIINTVKSSQIIWNSSLECLDVPFDKLDEEDYLSMKTSLSVPKLASKKYGDFDVTEIVDIPIRPLNSDHAKKWILMLIERFLEIKYTGKNELRDYYKILRDSNTFQTYSHVFKELTIEYVIKELHVDENCNAFWNLQAPMDLFMDLDQKFIIQNRRSDIKQGDRLSMLDFVNMIVDNDLPDKLIFSSKYVLKDLQIKKFELFAEAFQLKGVKDILLVTSEQVNVKNPNILVETYEEVYNGERAPHDRYFAYRSNGMWNLFKMSAELDQCRYSTNGIATIKSVGTWSDISFMQIKREAFPAKLYDKLSSFEEVYQV
jgi:hypothetical protein